MFFFRLFKSVAVQKICMSIALPLLMFLNISVVHAKGNYAFSGEAIDVVIPTTHKDLITLELCIQGIKENCQNIGRVIVVSSERFTLNAEWFDEKNYPFSKEEVGFYLCQCDETLSRQYVNRKSSRVGWYYQQLLKLYAPFVIPNLSSNVLILDSDTIFLNPVNFINASHAGIYNVGDEYCAEYFQHMRSLTGGLVKKIYPDYSGICHHMLFQKPVLEDLFQIVENLHKKEFWKAFCACVQRINGSGASEYELYFNFVIPRSNKIEIRKLKWCNIQTIGMMHKMQKQGYHYVSCHRHYRDG